jgi:CBS domain-containing protein/ribosome-associated translation inhibitor RaiA
MRLEEIMTTGVVTIGPDEQASIAWSRMERERIRHLIVLDAGSIVGMLSERDLGGRSGAALRRGRVVRELMTKTVATAKPGTTLRQAANLMSGRLIGALPVVSDDRVVGIVTATDVLEELGRGSSRPSVAAQRRSMRLPPARVRSATVRKARASSDRSTRPRARSKKSARKAAKGGAEPAAARGPAGSGGSAPQHRSNRVSIPDSARREPMAASVPRPFKAQSGRAETGETPAFIRAVGTELDFEDREYLRRKLGRRLGKFAPSIERVSVRIEDVNGPRGGLDKRCRIKVVLSGLPSVMVEEQRPDLQPAMDGALARTERAVRRTLQRRGAQALKGRQQLH